MPNVVYFRRCIAAWAVARQRAIDLASAVDCFEGNLMRWWRTDVSMLNDDRRIPIVWVIMVAGFK